VAIRRNCVRCIILRTSGAVAVSFNEVLSSWQPATSDSNSSPSNQSVTVPHTDEQHNSDVKRQFHNIRKMLVTLSSSTKDKRMMWESRNDGASGGRANTILRPGFVAGGKSTAVVRSCRGKPGCRVYSSASA
jgi:hypothetical protein